MAIAFNPCERCGKAISLLYSIFPAPEVFPYLDICVECVADLSWTQSHDYFRGHDIADGADDLLWTLKDGQLFDPFNPTGESKQ